MTDEDNEDDEDEPLDDADIWDLPADVAEGEQDLREHRHLSWRQLETRGGRRLWFEQLWSDVCALRLRYRLPVRSRWWEDEILLEALAALAAWVDRFDSGLWDDPPGKLTLLFELEHLETLLRDGHDPFDPHRDRLDFDRHLELKGLAVSSEP